MKVSKAPQNFYTASTAARKLGMSKTTFHEYVRKGKIKKVVPPGGTEGYYPKKDIDQMVKAKELFILQYASEPSNFRRATEADLPSLHDLLVSIFGYSNATPYETVKSWYKQNPETYYVLTQENIVTGYIGFLYLKDETTAQIMRATEPGTPIPDASDVLPFTPGKPIHGLWIGLGVRPGLPERQARYHGRHLITGATEVLENLAKRGMPVHKLYATSQTTSGTKLSRDLSFREIRHPNEPLIRFELDLEATKLPLAKEYQTIVRRQQKKIATKLDFGLALAEDASEIHTLTASVSGGEAHAVPAEVLKAWIRKNPWSIHILRREHEIVGYISMFPLSEDTLIQRLSGKLMNRTMPIDDIQDFTPNKTTNLYIAEMAVKHLPEHLKNQEPDFDNPDPIAKQIGARLIKEAARFVINLQKQGTIISEVYAVGTSLFGIQMCKDLGMKPIDLPEGVRENRIPFKLDLTDDDNSRLLRRLLQRTKAT
jgi:hypothetical protein